MRLSSLSMPRKPSPRGALEERVKSVEHIELETTPDFFEVFVEGCRLEPMPASFRPQAALAS